MTIDSFDIEKTLARTRILLEKEKGLSPALLASLETLLLLVTLLFQRLGLNSSNSSKPPSSDINRSKRKSTSCNKKRGGQKGHEGTTLTKDPNPDKIEFIKFDRKKLPTGTYHKAGYEERQVIDISISKLITSYRVEVLEDEFGKRFIADFPDGITRPVQYGDTIKAQSVYLSQHQLLPYNRIAEFFEDQIGLTISAGSIFNFNKEAYDKLQVFEDVQKSKLMTSDLCHVDETGINIDGSRFWLHCASNRSWTYFHPHQKRGCEAIDYMGIIPNFRGVLCHDHWKPYFRYLCQHALCNAHHLRELERAWEQDKQKWAKEMKGLLLKIHQNIKTSKNMHLTKKQIYEYTSNYATILAQAEIECPAPITLKSEKKRGKLKRSKARNLLERLTNFQKETLRFMNEINVPFTNNQGENDIRMTKVQQKISGCFRSMNGAKMFCRIRGYISTCRKNNVHASNALKLLYESKLPSFCYETK